MQFRAGAYFTKRKVAATFAFTMIACVQVCCLAGSLLDGAELDRGAPAMRELTDVLVFTDTGTRIPVRAGNQAAPASSDENALLKTLHLEHTVRQTAPADPRYNCHGWVFTGGRYCVDDVEAILEENGYREVTDVRVGDVVVYKRGGYITHTAVVVEVSYDGTVIVESKWSLLGRYLHRAADSCFGDNITYHRSPRSGHLLAGIDGRSR